LYQNAGLRSVDSDIDEERVSVCEFGASHVNELNLQGTKELYEKACSQLEELVTNLERFY
jgi:hypothetical protein